MLRLTTFAAVLAASVAAHAHTPGVPGMSGRDTPAPLDAAGAGWIIAALAIAAIAYGAGVARLWRASGIGRGVRVREAASFAAGWLVLALALLGPADTWAARSFAAHMAQHEALMLVAAPLLVHGRPLAAWSWIMAPTVHAAMHRLFTRSAWRYGWHACTRPLGATVLQLAALFAWHVPPWFDHAVTHAGVHALQHTSFLAAALCFWWAMRTGRAPRGDAALAASGVAIACIFVTMLATGALGALLALAPRPWYHAYGEGAPWGFSALEDQQLGGLLMWVPGGTAYLLAGLVHAARILRRDSANFAPPAIADANRFAPLSR